MKFFTHWIRRLGSAIWGEAQPVPAYATVPVTAQTLVQAPRPETTVPAQQPRYPTQSLPLDVRHSPRRQIVEQTLSINQYHALNESERREVDSFVRFAYKQRLSDRKFQQHLHRRTGLNLTNRTPEQILNDQYAMDRLITNMATSIEVPYESRHIKLDRNVVESIVRRTKIRLRQAT
ncbi:MAG: hypothetical protein ABIH92_04685 [Nanoarchaeota archaeon]